MTSITLPTDLEERLTVEARRRGTTAERLAIESLHRLFASPSEVVTSDGGTLLDFLAGYVGTVAGTGENLSDETERHFADYLVEKHGRDES